MQGEHYAGPPPQLPIRQLTRFRLNGVGVIMQGCDPHPITMQKWLRGLCWHGSWLSIGSPVTADAEALRLSVNK